MRVIPFDGDYRALTDLFGMSPEELAARDEAVPGVKRWIVVEDSRVTLTARALRRPDNRWFATATGESATARATLAAELRPMLGAPVHISVTDLEADYRRALLDHGFEVEVEIERFSVRFEKALSALERAWMPSRFATISAADADLDRLFRLDNRLRSLVPGSEGWQGDFSWFRAEIEEDEAFHRDGYLVAVNEASDEYVGIVRVWRNETAPRVGFLGVTPSLRRVPIGPALLKAALTHAATWGWDSFVTETALTNTVVYPRLARLAERSLGRQIQLRLD